jgi:hypothetical protein
MLSLFVLCFILRLIGFHFRLVGASTPRRPLHLAAPALGTPSSPRSSGASSHVASPAPAHLQPGRGGRRGIPGAAAGLFALSCSGGMKHRS